MALESLLAAPDRGLERLIRKKARALKAADIRSSLKRAKIKIDFPAPSVSIDPEKVAPTYDARPRKKGGTSRHEAGKKAAATAREMADATLESLIAFGLIKAPFELERAYKGTHLTAVVEQNGKVTFGGEAYDSLSTAGGMARKQVIGAPPDRPYPQTNGWTFWQYRDDKGGLQPVETLRKQYLGLAKSANRKV